MMLKRSFDLFASCAGLILLSPLFLVIALLIKRDSPGPIFYRQERVGQGGKTFRIHKFRTMHVDAARSGSLTVGSDPRITRTGGWLRRYKLDELPQLIDVFVGSMSIVGPRPEVPRYVEQYPADVRSIVLSVRPGITDFASIEYRNESEILGRSKDPESTYVREIMPHKLALAERYVRTRSFGVDMLILAKTVLAVFFSSEKGADNLTQA